MTEPLDSGARYRAELFSRLFPRPVAAAATMLSPKPYQLFPEEAEAIGNAVAKRRNEFAAGRHCARLAMAQLGYRACGIPSGRDRMPVWPPQLAGSITHSDGLCAAVVARSDSFRSVGIDTEPVGAIPMELAKEILRPDEAAEFERNDPPRDADWPTLCFCLKEAAYKACYPIYRRIVGFKDVRVRRIRGAGTGTFFAEFLGLAGGGPPIFQGAYVVRHGRIYAACW